MQLEQLDFHFLYYRNRRQSRQFKIKDLVQTECSTSEIFDNFCISIKDSSGARNEHFDLFYNKN